MTIIVRFFYYYFFTQAPRTWTTCCVGSYHRSTWREEKVLSAASRVKSLKPHCVSLIPLTQKNHTREWKPYMRNVRKTDRCRTDSAVISREERLTQEDPVAKWTKEPITWATDSFSKCALEPQEIAILSWMDRQAFLVMALALASDYVCMCETKGKHTGLGLSSLSPASTFSRSGNFVAPSASAMRMSFPLELIVPFRFCRRKRMVKCPARTSMRAHTHTKFI